jgi:phage regulator Rha-like protein
MDNLVFLTSNSIDAQPFTTSKVIAECAKVQHHTVTRLIQKYESDLREFGKVRFEIEASIGSTTGQMKKIYHLNEEQATLLMTYLKNTAPVRKFKKELVRQFYLMRSELQKRQIAKMDRKPIRRELTDVIQSDPNHSKWDFKIFTDLAYKTVLGKNAAQIRKERGADKHATASDYMTAEEIQAVTKLEYQISALKELGMSYQQIKMLLLNRQVVGNIA